MAVVKQGITVTSSKSKDIKDWFDEDTDFLILVKKTGYYNFSIDGKQYYFDQRVDTSKITNSLLVFCFNGGNDDKKKKGKITVTKK